MAARVAAQVADDTTLSAIGSSCGASTLYQSTRLHARVFRDGQAGYYADASGLAGVAFTSSNPSVVEVVGTTAVGRSPGSASVCLAASPQECVSITVTSVATTPTNLLARAVTGARSTARRRLGINRPVALAAQTATPTSNANGVDAHAPTAQLPVAPTQASTMASRRPKKSAAAAHPTAPMI